MAHQSAAPPTLDYATVPRGGVDHLRLVFLLLSAPSLAVPFVRCWFGEPPWELLQDGRAVSVFKAVPYLIVYPLLAWKVWLGIRRTPPGWACWLGYALAALSVGASLAYACDVLLFHAAQDMMGGFFLVFESIVLLPALLAASALVLLLAWRTKAHVIVAESAMFWSFCIAAFPGALVLTGNSRPVGTAIIWWTLVFFAVDSLILAVRAWQRRPR